MIGEVVLAPKLRNVSTGEIIEFNIEDLSSGIYYLSFKQSGVDDNTLAEKVIGNHSSNKKKPSI